MEQVSIIDLAKRSFSLHGARADGSVAFRRSLSRLKVLHFLEQQAKCIVEACGSSHYWGREIAKLGHEVRLLPPRQTLRQASEERRGGRGGDRRSRVPPDDAIRRREDRGTAVAWNGRHEACSCGSGPRRSTRFAVILAEFGIVAPQGAANVRKLEDALLASPELPDLVHRGRPTATGV